MVVVVAAAINVAAVPAFVVAVAAAVAVATVVVAAVVGAVVPPYSRGHGSVPHTSVSFSSPWQSIPPLEGEGLVQARVRKRVPEPYLIFVIIGEITYFFF